MVRLFRQRVVHAGVLSTFGAGMEENIFIHGSILDRFDYIYTLATGSTEGIFLSEFRNIIYFLIIK
jgi:hypothetical protein